MEDGVPARPPDNSGEDHVEQHQQRDQADAQAKDADDDYLNVHAASFSCRVMT